MRVFKVMYLSVTFPLEHETFVTTGVALQHHLRAGLSELFQISEGVT